MVSYWSFMAVLPLLAQTVLADAQCMTYSTATVTDCGPTTTPAPPKPTKTPCPEEVITIIMPKCPSCDCKCSHTKTYTTIYEAFCPTGVTKVTYTVEEVYQGMSTAPVFPTPTGVPEGFTTTVATCNSCGSAPITRTLTYPSGGSPSVPTAGPSKPAQPGSGGNQPAQPGSGGNQPAQPGSGGNQPSQPGSGDNQPGQPGCSGSNCPPVIAAGSKLESLSGHLLAVAAAIIML